MKSVITRSTKVILEIMLIMGMSATVTLPFSLKWYGDNVDKQLLQYKWQMVIIFAVCGIFAVLILWELRRVFKTVINNDCFVINNVMSLSRMGTCSFAISLMMIVRCGFYPTLASIAMIVVFLIAGLFSKVLAQVFDKAVEYKLENDLTI